MADTRPLKVVVVGYGYWSPKLIRNINLLPGLTLAAIVEKDESRHAHIKEEHPGTSIYRRYQDAFAVSDIDAVIIATIPSSHYRIARSALEHGKHVLVEKPLTLSVEEGEILRRLAASRDLTLMVDHTYLYAPAIGALRETIRSGKLGSLYSIESVRTNLGLFQRDANVVWDLAPHDFSILLHLIPERPTHIRALGTKTVVHKAQSRSQESTAHLILSYESGLMAHIHVSWTSPVKTRQITVVGSERMALYDQLADDQVLLFDQGVYPADTEGETGPLFRYKIGETTPVAYDRSGEDLARMLSDFGEAVRSGAKPRSDAGMGLETVALLCAAERSLKQGGRSVRIRYRAGNPVRYLRAYLRPR